MEKARISGIQLYLLMLGFLIGSTVIIDPISSAKRDGWLAILIGGTCGALLIGIYTAIAMLNPSKTLVEILRDRFGKYLGNAVAILYIWYFIHLASLVFRDFGEFITTVSFPETPMIVVIGLFALLLVYEINSGVEVMGRLGELFVPIIPVVVLIVCLSLITTRDFTAFLPILENGMGPVLNAAFAFITFPLGETVVFLMLFPHLNKGSNLKKVAAISIVTKLTFSFLIFFRDLFVLGAELKYQGTFTPHLTSMLIPHWNVEPLIDINLLIGGGIKISVCLYAAVKALCQVTGIDDYRKLTAAVAIFTVMLSIWVHESVVDLLSWTERVWAFYSVPFQVIIPVILLVLSLINRSKSLINRPKPSESET